MGDYNYGSPSDDLPDDPDQELEQAITAYRSQLYQAEALFEGARFQMEQRNGTSPHSVMATVHKQLAEILSRAPKESDKVFVESLKPSQLRAYKPKPGTILVGDHHIERGSVFVVAGAPGVGKSRSGVALAEAGATKLDWFGLPVHCNFKTLIVQNENGQLRLQMEFAEMDDKLMDQYVRVTPPPAFGLCFARSEFRDQLKAIIEEHQPGVILLDPWNAVARDDKTKDYLETFDTIRSVIPAGEDGAALGIFAHTRKPLPNERANGRALLNLLAGSYVLASVPRCVFVLQSASDDVMEDRVVVTCCKNNNGELGHRGVYTRENGQWPKVEGFDWEAWDHGDKKGEKRGESQAKFSIEKVVEIVAKSTIPPSRKELAGIIMENHMTKKHRLSVDFQSRKCLANQVPERKGRLCRRLTVSGSVTRYCIRY
jgi:hypothetical protein